MRVADDVMDVQLGDDVPQRGDVDFVGAKFAVQNAGNLTGFVDELALVGGA